MGKYRDYYKSVDRDIRVIIESAQPASISVDGGGVGVVPVFRQLTLSCKIRSYHDLHLKTLTISEHLFLLSEEMIVERSRQNILTSFAADYPILKLFKPSRLSSLITLWY